VNGNRAVFLRVNKQPGANTVAVVDQLKELMPRLIGVPPGVNLAITLDQSIYIRQAIESLWHEALQGSFLAFLVILVFLRSLTSTLIISIAIPPSILPPPVPSLSPPLLPPCPPPPYRPRPCSPPAPPPLPLLVFPRPVDQRLHAR